MLQHGHGLQIAAERHLQLDLETGAADVLTAASIGASRKDTGTGRCSGIGGIGIGVRIRSHSQRQRATSASWGYLLAAAEGHQFKKESSSLLTKPSKSPPKLRRHQVVEDGVHCRVEVKHNPAKVQETVVAHQTEVMKGLVRAKDDPEGEHPKGQQADEEGQHHGAEHQDHLLAGPQTELRFRWPGPQHGAPVGDEVLGYDAVQHHQGHKGQDEEHGDGHQEEGDRPVGDGLGEADGHRGSVNVLGQLVLGHPQNGAARGSEWGERANEKRNQVAGSAGSG